MGRTINDSVLLLYRQRCWRFLAGLGLSALLWVGLRPDPVPQYVPDFDKWMHALAFAAVSLMLLQSLHRRHWWAIVTFMLVLGPAIELGQEWLLPRRVFDWADVAMDTLGVLVALGLFMLPAVYRWAQKGVKGPFK